MKRLLYPASLLVLICGCHHQGPPGRDPFFGRTTVPPPPTGAAGAAIDPYLQGGRSRMGSVVPPAPGHADVAVPASPVADPLSVAQPANSRGWMSAGSVPAGGTGASLELADARLSGDTGAAALPSSRGSPGVTSAAGNAAPSVIRIVEPASATQPISAAPVGASSAGVQNATAPGQPTPADTSLGAAILAGRPRVVRTLQPRKLASTSPGASSAGADTLPGRSLPAGTSAGASRGAVDIFDLPPVDRGATASSPQAGAAQAVLPGGASAAGEPNRLVSAEVPQGGPAPVAAAAYEQPADFAAPGRYGYDPEYRWLRGRLEYSQILRRWKLRYIAIDGQTDRYGGSVILADESLLAGCERGEFVEIQGRLGNHDPREGFAPEYEVSALKRLGS